MEVEPESGTTVKCPQGLNQRLRFLDGRQDTCDVDAVIGMPFDVDGRLDALRLTAEDLQGLKGKAYVPARVCTGMRTIVVGIRNEIACPDLLWTKDVVTQLLEVVLASVISILYAQGFSDRTHGGSGNDEMALDDRSLLWRSRPTETPLIPVLHLSQLQIPVASGQLLELGCVGRMLPYFVLHADCLSGGP